MRKKKILLVEDHQLVRDGLRLLLEDMGDYEVVGMASNGYEALEMAENLQPDIIFMDLYMADMNGFQATERLMRIDPAFRIIILSGYIDEQYVVEALQAGAAGYLHKDDVTDQMPVAIDTVLSGHMYLSERLPRHLIETKLRERESLQMPIDRLTPREREILQLVAEGNTNRQVAAKLSISVKTVEKHRFNLMEKLNIRDVTGLVRFAINNGVINTTGV